MHKSAFRHAFDWDLRRTTLEDPGLGARVLAADPALEDAGAAELIAGGRVVRASGLLTGKPGLRLAAMLIDLGAWDEAVAVLEDPACDYSARESPRSLVLARALAAGGRLGEAKTALERAHRLGLDPKGVRLAGALTRALEGASGASVAQTVDDLCLLNLPALAAQMLMAPLARGGDDAQTLELLDSAFDVLRMASPETAAGLLEAMAPLYRADGREESLRATLALMAGGADAGVEPESEGSSRRQLLLRACLAEACAAARLWPGAIQRFDFVGKKWGDPDECLSELARCVGRDLLDRNPVRLLAPQGERRILDIFAYNGEAVMLQLKLADMAGWVDQFVLVEADETFPGRPKPLHFHDDPAAAAGPYADRIRPVVVPTPPSYVDFTWAREFFQKDCAVLGLDGLGAPGDVVILSDADEFLKREVVAGFDGDVASCALRTFKFFLNCELAKPQLKTAVTRARHAAAHGWNYLRLGAIRYRSARALPDAGWHFTNIGDPEWLAYKMQCTAHEEWAYQDRDFFARKLPKFRKALGPGYVRSQIDETFPASVRARRDALADFIL
jgi:hypothetical protein